jgi:hypothetical protein
MIPSLVPITSRRRRDSERTAGQADAPVVVRYLRRDAAAASRSQAAERCGDSPRVVVDYPRLVAALPMWKASFDAARPFPHLVIDDFLSADAAGEARALFPAPDAGEWTHYHHLTERKIGRSRVESFADVHRCIVEELSSARFIEFLERLTGIPGLLADPGLEGAGLHQSERGGFVSVHADFRSHPTQATWLRRVNVLIYLNDDWDEQYGGDLELWDAAVSRCVARVQPHLNRCVIFCTDARTFHGHPRPLQCPTGTTRKSLALYYYTSECRPTPVRATVYQGLPGDHRVRRALIAAENKLLSAYAYAKRRLGLDDSWVSRLLKAVWR